MTDPLDELARKYGKKRKSEPERRQEESSIGVLVLIELFDRYVHETGSISIPKDIRRDLEEHKYDRDDLQEFLGDEEHMVKDVDTKFKFDRFFSVAIKYYCETQRDSVFFDLSEITTPLMLWMKDIKDCSLVLKGYSIIRNKVYYVPFSGEEYIIAKPSTDSGSVLGVGVYNGVWFSFDDV